MCQALCYVLRTKQTQSITSWSFLDCNQRTGEEEIERGRKFQKDEGMHVSDFYPPSKVRGKRSGVRGLRKEKKYEIGISGNGNVFLRGKKSILESPCRTGCQFEN